MFGVGAATRIYVVTGNTDMRLGFNGLYALVRSRLESDPLSGTCTCSPIRGVIE